MPVFARHIFKQLLHTDVFSWCIFFRLNLSRWTRRTRPTHWYLWPPCPRNPSTNPLSTGSLHQKTGPAPQLTGTLPAGALWLTLRCESHVHVLRRDTPTQVPVHTGTAVTAEAAFTFLPFSFFFKHSVHLHGFEYPSSERYSGYDHFKYMLQDPISFRMFPGYKSEYDVYMHKHKNGIPKNPSKTKILKSMQTHGHQPQSTWSYDHKSNAHNVKSWGSLRFQVNKRNLLSSNDLA